MLEASLQGLLAVFSFPAFFYMLLGVALGLIVGILPGVGGGFAMAILMPFVFKLDAASAIAMLMGIHAVSYTGGAITTILLNTPGDPPNAATLFDGFPMTKRGEAGRALGAALSASAFGGLVGALILGLLIPVMRPLVLAFGPPEFFMMAMLGIAFIAVLSSGSFLKGLVTGVLGLLLGLIGLDPSTGIARFSFGSLFLWDGINIIPASLGLFALAEVIELAVQGGSISQEAAEAGRGGVIQGIRDTLRNWWLVVRCAALGNWIGMVPGIGGNTACFVAYGHAKQTAKNADQFGKGAVEGVIAPQSAINAKESGDIVPTIAFGVPGSSSTAILLGALMIKGLDPGPEMLTVNVSLVFMLVWTLVIANILATGTCLAFANRMARVALLPGGLIAPIVLVLAFIGAYAVKGSMGDVVVTIIFGLLGYAMMKLNYPRATLIIGLVLARVAEKNLHLSIKLYHYAWLLRPITLALILITVLTLYFFFRSERRKKQATTAVAEGGAL